MHTVHTNTYTFMHTSTYTYIAISYNLTITHYELKGKNKTKQTIKNTTQKRELQYKYC